MIIHGGHIAVVLLIAFILVAINEHRKNKQELQRLEKEERLLYEIQRTKDNNKTIDFFKDTKWQ